MGCPIDRMGNGMRAKFSCYDCDFLKRDSKREWQCSYEYVTTLGRVVGNKNFCCRIPMAGRGALSLVEDSQAGSLSLTHDEDKGMLSLDERSN